VEETEEVVEEVIVEGTSKVILLEVQVAAGETLVVVEIISIMETVSTRQVVLLVIGIITIKVQVETIVL